MEEKKNKLKHRLSGGHARKHTKEIEEEQRISPILPQNIVPFGRLKSELQGLHHKNDEPIEPGTRKTGNSRRSGIIEKKLTEKQAYNIFETLTPVKPRNIRIFHSEKTLLIRGNDPELAYKFIMENEVNNLKIFICKDCMLHNRKVYAMYSKTETRHDTGHLESCKQVPY